MAGRQAEEERGACRAPYEEGLSSVCCGQTDRLRNGDEKEPVPLVTDIVKSVVFPLACRVLLRSGHWTRTTD